MEPAQEDLCSCGSGELYRRCCGNDSAPSADHAVPGGIRDLRAAARHFRAGRLSEARVALQELLQAEPGNADALHMLGGVEFRSGNLEAAVSLTAKAIELGPDVPAFHGDLGNLLKAQGHVQKAIECYQRALELKPDFLEARYNLGICYAENGFANEAVKELREVLLKRPSLGRAHMAIGNVYKRLNNLDAAIEHYRQAVSLHPKFAEAHYNLANVLFEQNDDGSAIEHYEQAVRLKPNFAVAHINLGNALLKMGRLDKALEHHRRGVELLPESAHAHASIANAYKALYRQRLAVRHYSRALSLRPDSWRVLMDLGSVLTEQGRLQDAQVAFERAHSLRPDSAEIYSYLGRILRAQGWAEQSLPLLEKAIALAPDNPSIFSSLLLTLNYSSSYEPGEVFEWHKEFARRFADRFPQPWSSTVRRNSRELLRVGYVSADFRRHSVAYFIEPILAHHDGSRFNVFGYYNNRHTDETTRRLADYCHRWRNISGVPDERVVGMIREDGIDILVDLSGHTAYNRLLVFGRRAAPIQVNWLGYPNTTGLPTVDYKLTDSVIDPPGVSESLYTEELVRLQGCFSCYRAPEGAPDVGELPALRNGYVTFGCFNNFAKVSTDVLECYAAILTAVRDSRLILKSLGLGDTLMQKRILEFFGRRGIEPGRVEVLGKDVLPEDHLRRYNQVDVGLDPFPYNGATTTCEAAWMGIPVIVLAGRSHAGRVGASLMTALGLQGFVAETREDYVAIAVSLARDPAGVARMRAGMRERMKTSALMDEAGLTRQIERAYEKMWERRSRSDNRGAEP